MTSGSLNTFGEVDIRSGRVDDETLINLLAGTAWWVTEFIPRSLSLPNIKNQPEARKRGPCS